VIRAGKYALIIPFLFLIIILAAVSVSVPALSAEEDWERLTAESFELFRHGQYDEAIRISREALEATEQVFEPRHPIIGKSMNNLGAILSKHGDTAEAERLLTGALDILEESLGKGHPGISSALNNLADLYSGEGRYEEAEPLFLRALSIREKDPGVDHIDLITSIDNLASMYFSEGRFEEALPLFIRGLNLKEEHLGWDHPDVTVSWNNITQLYIRLGDSLNGQERFQEAAMRYGQAHAAMIGRKPGPDVSESSIVLEKLAVAFVRAGNYEGAIIAYNSLIKDKKGIHGENSIEVSRSTIDLARVYMRMEIYDQAVPFYEAAVAIQKARLSADDPELLRSLTEQASALNSLANIYLESGKTAKAVPLLASVIEIKKSTGYPDDPARAIRINNLAGLLVGLEDYEEAEMLYTEALEILDRSAGERISDRTVILQNMRQLYNLTGDGEKAAAVDSLLGLSSGKP
jgi:tetratricopeptide (TPR) repeat protein